MNQEELWLLPDGVEEILPEQAVAVESLRRRLLNLFSGWGYQLVFPPLIEFLESLLNGAGRDLEHDTFKLTDQLSGRLMGVRADITPQVARIDAHSLPREGTARFCYCSTAMRANISPANSSRLPYQIGVELFGHAGFESDAEILNLLLDTLAESGAQDITLELGHVGVFHALVAAAGFDDTDIDQLSDIYQRKAVPELAGFLANYKLPANLAAVLLQLPKWCGDAALLENAADALADFPVATQALHELRELVRWVGDVHPDTNIYLDLAELRGYRYHTGCVFSAYQNGNSEPLAKGGRYDHIGEVFGRARPATGFSANLIALAAIQPARQPLAIFAEGDIRDPAFRQAVAAQRAKGNNVVLALSDADNATDLHCDRRLVIQDGKPQLLPAT